MKPLLTQRTYINAILWIALIILMGSNILAYQQTQRLMLANDWVVHTYKVIGAANNAEVALDNAALVINQAILSGQTVAVNDIVSYAKEADINIQLIGYLTQDNMLQQNRVAQLESLTKERSALLENIATDFQNKNTSSMVLHAERMKQQELRTTIAGIINNIIQDEQQLLQERNDISLRTSQKTNLILLCAMGLGISLFFLSLLLLNYYLNQRDQAERKRAQAEENMRLIVDDTKDYAIIMLDPNGIVSTWNAGAEKIIGYRAEEIIGQDFSCFYTKDAINKHLPEKALQIAKDKGRFEDEGWRVRKDSAQFWASDVITSLHDRSGHFLGFGKITRDLTERNKIEKMKNEFISVISHELRTPITSIRGALGLIIGGTVGTFTDKAKKLLDIANQNCERLLLLINDILDIEKIEAGKMDFQLKIVDLQQVVEEAISANKIYAEKYGVNIALSKSTDNIKVHIDTDRMIQVLTNLLSNAVKFSFKDGTVNVAISADNNTARVSVTNKGHGILKEFQPFIFQKFSQADSSNTRGKGGTGLGLNISKAIIEKMGGTLNFNSIPDEETTFYFNLDRWKNTSIKTNGNITLLQNEDDKLLICEDDEDQAKYLQALLNTAGIESDIAYTVSEAKKLLAVKSYRGLLLDLILPDQDGIAFIRELRNDDKTRHLPIIVLSIIAQTGRTLINGDAFSIVDWLEKPIDFTKLLKAISLIKIKMHPHKPHILHVEDDLDTQQIIKSLLEDHVNMTSVISLDDAREQIKNHKFDLVVLDLLLPDGNGAELLPIISKRNIPIIVYSSVELDKEYAQYVHQALIKSKTSNDDLINAIKNILVKNEQGNER